MLGGLGRRLWNATQVAFAQPGTRSVPILLHKWIEAYPLNSRAYGVLADGSDMSPKLSDAVNDLKDGGGGDLILPRGVITLNGLAGADGKKNGILIPYSSQALSTGRVSIRGQGKSTILRAGSTGMYVLRLADSLCSLQDLTIDGNGLGTVSGLGIVPEDTTQIVTLVYQMFNFMKNIEIRSCVEGLEMKCGPDVGGTDSGCWYNEFHGVNLYSNTRGIWLRDGPNASSSGVHRNKFFGGRCGQAPANTGLQIDAGGSNEFHGMSFEGITNGATPNAIPTAIKIGNLDAWGSSNESNRFFGCHVEACTRDLNNANAISEFYGCNLNIDGMLLTATPLMMLGGYDASITPQILQGLLYQANGQVPGYENGKTYLTGAGGAIVKSGTLRNKGQNTGTGPGGSLTNFDFDNPFTGGDCYLVARGGFDATGANYAIRVSVFVETPSGTFTEGTKIVDITGGGTTWSVDTVSRSAGNVRSAVNVAKAATTFTNFASVTRLNG